MLRGRLGLEHARIPHVDRHGLIYLERGAMSVEDGCLRFIAAGSDMVVAGNYRIAHQSISLVLMRLLARHGTALSAIGEDGVRFYTAQPLMPDSSALGRTQARAWADAKGERMAMARRMYAWRLGEVLPHRDIAVLRGKEGARVKEIYRLTAERVGIRWNGRHYDRPASGRPAESGAEPCGERGRGCGGNRSRCDRNDSATWLHS
jgi:CRISPR-associated protein Cas1